MKTVILAGGLGTRIREETGIRPKPMIEVGGHPIIWHIMNNYSSFGYSDFIVAAGYKSHVIKEYFLNYYNMASDLTINLGNGSVEAVKNCKRDWQVRVVDTGDDSMTGGRLKRLEKDLRGERFMLTYGDGLADVNIKELLAFHEASGKLATVTAVRPVARFGEISISEDSLVEGFQEKPQTSTGWINGGFFVFEPEVFDYLDGDETVLEAAPLERLAADGQLAAFQHTGFWQCMDTVRDRDLLESLWSGGNAPWKVWEDE